MNDPFRFLLRVRYSECDGQLVVFNARYADYVDIAATEYFRVLFGGYPDLLANGYDNQVVSLTINWTSPARFDDVVDIRITPVNVGNSSFSMQVEFNEFHTQRRFAVADITYVMVSTEEYKKAPIPEHYRAKLENGAPGVVINQGGVEFAGAATFE